MVRVGRWKPWDWYFARCSLRTDELVFVSRFIHARSDQPRSFPLMPARTLKSLASFSLARVRDEETKKEMKKKNMQHPGWRNERNLSLFLALWRGNRVGRSQPDRPAVISPAHKYSPKRSRERAKKLDPWSCRGLKNPCHRLLRISYRTSCLYLYVRVLFAGERERFFSMNQRY